MMVSEKRKIYFRADAGQEIGYGHYIRSLALADMLKQDFDCTMFTQTPSEYQLREAEGICAIVALPEDDSKFDKFLEYLKGDEIVVLDNYFFTTDYQKAIKAKGCKLVCIDDMHDKHYVADVVINHGAATLEDFDGEPYTRYCLGAEYALLRRPFLEHEEGKHKKGVYVVCFGGSDPYNLTAKYINLLVKIKKVSRIFAIIGDGYRYLDTIVYDTNVQVLKNQTAKQMATILLEAEAIICSASSICMEAMACGTKVYAGWYVENQKAGYEQAINEHRFLPLGNLIDDTIIPDETNVIPIIYNREIINRFIKTFKQL